MAKSPAPSRLVPPLLQQEIRLLELLRTRLWLGTHDELLYRLDEALELARCPRCAEVQADGVPCDTAESDCDRCARALLHIRGLRTELEKAVDLEEGVLVEPLDI
ncbi:MAG: hypothetical protein PVF68_11055 [Acidobacteriota bacterium]|jgi:hypothetical protein